MSKKENSTSNSTVPRMLRYAAAGLSAVSFITTLHGVNGIVTDNYWLAGLISFGIQAIILVLGLWCIPTIKLLYSKFRVIISVILAFLLIVLYLFAITFSSFFSYVYMSNAAYTKVKPTDYNMELELFLMEETRTLKNYNTAIHDVLLQGIRQTSPKFRALLQNYQQMSTSKIHQIVGNISKYEVSTIPDSLRVSAEELTNTYEVVNGENSVTAELMADFQRFERDIGVYADYYNTQYYPKYSDYFEALLLQTDSSQLQARQNEIDTLISTMVQQTELLGQYTHFYTSVSMYLQSKCTGIISQYNALIIELKNLQNKYMEISQDSDANQGEVLTLRDFYDFIYSDNESVQRNFDKAKVDLEEIASTYIKNSDINDIDEELVSNLVECIGWMDKLNQSLELDRKIERFDKENLAKTYSIISSSSSTGTSSNLSSAPTSSLSAAKTSSQAQEQVDESEWNAIRHKDMAEFISLIKGLPDVEQIPLETIAEDSPAIITLREMIDQNYVSSTLLEAHKLNRAKLENISDLETAWGYLSSDNRFLAICSLIIAIFLDVSSFLIGLILYGSPNRKRSRPTNLSVEEPESCVSEEESVEDK